MKKEFLDLTNYIVATYDIETDPFKEGRKPEPFSWGFYRGEQSVKTFEDNLSDSDAEFLEQWQTLTKEEKQRDVNKYRVVKRRQQKARIEVEEITPELYKDFWTKDPKENAESFMSFIETLEVPHLIFAHNGGKFDYMYLFKYIRGDVMMINNRLVEWKYTTQKGITHVFRDSYAILPIPLSSGGKKLDIDYRKMEKKVRHKHKEEIMTYLKQDCVALYEMVKAFYTKYKNWHLTMAGAAYARLKKDYKIEKTSVHYDDIFRQFYFGGRCQAFEVGEIKGDIQIYDVNSMYPFVMSEYNHPLGKHYYESDIITKETFFIKWEGKNFGAVPSRTETGEITFDKKEGEFFTSIHEFKVAKEYGLIDVDDVITTYNWTKYGNFKTLIDELYHVKENAPKGSNEYILAKLEMNSSYGKTAQDSRKYREYEYIDPDLDVIEDDCTVVKNEEFQLVIRPSTDELSFNNVAIGASITGGSRAYLLQSLIEFQKAGAIPLYMDTDSCICIAPTSEVTNLEFHPSKLGAWDLEKTGDQMYIAGKKIYALYEKSDCVKIASKGVRVVPRDIYEFLESGKTNYEDSEIKAAKRVMNNIGGERIKTVALGGEFKFENDAPSLKITGEHNFVHRVMRNTFKPVTVPKARY